MADNNNTTHDTATKYTSQQVQELAGVAYATMNALSIIREKRQRATVGDLNDLLDLLCKELDATTVPFLGLCSEDNQACDRVCSQVLAEIGKSGQRPQPQQKATPRGGEGWTQEALAALMLDRADYLQGFAVALDALADQLKGEEHDGMRAALDIQTNALRRELDGMERAAVEALG